jgi:hypothetical protein
MKYALLSVSLFMVSLDAYAFGAEILKLTSEQELAEHLQRLTKCEMIPPATEASLYCKLEFRGLKLQFAGVNARGGGTIYVDGLGKNQILNPLGRRCVVVRFMDKDLRFAGETPTLGAHIIFRDDGTILPNYKNEKARRECD